MNRNKIQQYKCNNHSRMKNQMTDFFPAGKDKSAGQESEQDRRLYRFPFAVSIQV